ncbi:MAG: SRPBCC family protein [Acidimicrobiales bacterium]
MALFEPPAEFTRQRTTVMASIDRCVAVATDLHAYPEWADGVTSVEVAERDDQGRPTLAAFVAEAIGRRTRYVLRYDHSGLPGRLSWQLTEGDLARRLDGVYTFEPAVDDPEATDVTYELAVDLAVPLPGFVKRRAEAKIVRAALPDFKRRAEALGAAAAADPA